jgi:hypothetical protein
VLRSSPLFPKLLSTLPLRYLRGRPVDLLCTSAALALFSTFSIQAIFAAAAAGSRKADGEEPNVLAALLIEVVVEVVIEVEVEVEADGLLNLLFLATNWDRFLLGVLSLEVEVEVGGSSLVRGGMNRE